MSHQLILDVPNEVYDPLADAGIDQLFRGFFQPVRATRDTAAAIKIDVTEKPDAFADPFSVVAGTKFMVGLPIKPATKRLAGWK